MIIWEIIRHLKLSVDVVKFRGVDKCYLFSKLPWKATFDHSLILGSEPGVDLRPVVCDLSCTFQSLEDLKKKKKKIQAALGGRFNILKYFQVILRQSRLRKVMQTFWHCLKYCFILRPFSSPDGRYSTWKKCKYMKSTISFTKWRKCVNGAAGRWGGEVVSPAGVCNFLPPSEGANHPAAGPGQAGGVQIPHSLYSQLALPCLCVWPWCVI